MPRGVDPIERIIQNLFLTRRLGTSIHEEGKVLLNELHNQIAEDIRRIDPSGPTLQKWRKFRTEELLDKANERLSGTVDNWDSMVRNRLAGVGVTQGQFAEGTLIATLGSGAIAGEVVRRTPITPGRLKSILETNPFEGFTLKEWSGGLKDTTFKRITQQIRLGMSAEEGIPELVRRIRGTQAGFTKNALGATVPNFVGGVWQATTRDAEAVVRTGVTYTSNIAALETYRENAHFLMGVQYSATLDDRTTVICLSLDGTIWVVDSPDIVIPGDTTHVGCRSMLIPVPDYEKVGLDPPPDGFRKARDLSGLDDAALNKKISTRRGQGLLGKQTDVRSNVIAEQWLKDQPIRVQNRMLGKGRAQLFRDGQLSLRDMVGSDNQVIPLRTLRGGTPPTPRGIGKLDLDLSLLEREAVRDWAVSAVDADSSLAGSMWRSERAYTALNPQRVLNDANAIIRRSLPSLPDDVVDTAYQAIFMGPAPRGVNKASKLDKIINKLGRKWGATSADGDDLAVALQMAIREEFNLAGTSQLIGVSDDVLARATVLLDDTRQVLRPILRTMQQATHQWMDDIGVDGFLAARGMDHADLAKLSAKGPVRELVSSRPASSWSWNAQIAESFGENIDEGVILIQRLDKDQILSTGARGLGTTFEAEVVALGEGFESVVLNKRAVREFWDFLNTKDQARWVNDYGKDWSRIAAYLDNHGMLVARESLDIIDDVPLGPAGPPRKFPGWEPKTYKNPAELTRQGLLAGVPDDEIIATIRELYPEYNSWKIAVPTYRRELIKKGLLTDEGLPIRSVKWDPTKFDSPADLTRDGLLNSIAREEIEDALRTQFPEYKSTNIAYNTYKRQLQKKGLLDDDGLPIGGEKPVGGKKIGGKKPVEPTPPVEVGTTELTEKQIRERLKDLETRKTAFRLEKQQGKLTHKQYIDELVEIRAQEGNLDDQLAAILGEKLEPDSVEMLRLRLRGVQREQAALRVRDEELMRVKGWATDPDIRAEMQFIVDRNAELNKEWAILRRKIDDAEFQIAQSSQPELPFSAQEAVDRYKEALREATGSKSLDEIRTPKDIRKELTPLVQERKKIQESLSGKVLLEDPEDLALAKRRTEVIREIQLLKKELKEATQVKLGYKPSPTPSVGKKQQREALRSLFRREVDRNQLEAIIDSGFSTRGGNKAREAFEYFNGLVHKRWTSGRKVSVRFDTRGRAFANKASIHFDNYVNQRTVIHELGHVIEFQHPEVHKAARTFWQRRTEGESFRKLRDITGSKFYDLDETAKPDKFIKAYMGKVYGNNTEIVSMGLEHFFADPVAFWEADPDYFTFIWELMNGRIPVGNAALAPK